MFNKDRQFNCSVLFLFLVKRDIKFLYKNGELKKILSGNPTYNRYLQSATVLRYSGHNTHITTSHNTYKIQSRLYLVF